MHKKLMRKIQKHTYYTYAASFRDFARNRHHVGGKGNGRGLNFSQIEPWSTFESSYEVARFVLIDISEVL